MTRKTDKNPFSGVIFPQTRNVAAEAKQRAQIFILYLFWGDCVLGQHQASQPGSFGACVLNGSLLLLHSHLDTKPGRIHIIKKVELSCREVSSADEQVSADSCQVAGITSCSMCWLPVLATCSFFFFPPRLLRWQCVWWVCVLRLLQCYRFCRCQCWFWQLDADVGGMVGFAASVTEEKILIYWTRCQFNLQGVLL